MTNRSRVSTTLVASVLALGAGVLAGCARRSASASEAPAATPHAAGDTVLFPENAPQLGYLSVEPVAAHRTAAIDLNGRLAWNDDVTTRVFSPVSGRIVEIIAEPGQHVAAGDTLAKIQSPDFGQVQADARKAGADARQAERVLRRARELVEHGAAPQKDAEAAEVEYAHALSEKERAEAALTRYGGRETAIDGVFLLKAPIGGVVVERSLSPGQEVRADQTGGDARPLFVISDPTRLWLFLDLTEVDAAAVRRGQRVQVRARALPDHTFDGRVEVVGEGLDAATRTLKARCGVDNAEKLLRAEMYVDADVEADGASGVDVSTKALFLKDGRRYAFVETAPGRFARRAVTVGTESHGRSVILDGLAPGQRVVTDGSLLLQAILDETGA